MVVVTKTDAFDAWLKALRDVRARAKVNIRIGRLIQGSAGDVRPVGEGISEMRIPHGPGYRVYDVVRGTTLVVLLAGGDKSTQEQDIVLAKRLAASLPRNP